MTSLLDAPPPRKTAGPAVAMFGTVAAHGAIVALASIAGATGVTQIHKLLPVTEMVEVELPKPPPPETPKAELPPDPTPAPRARVSEPAPPPAAAQAGQILDAKSDAVDFGDNFVTGTGDSFAGGLTDSAGTLKTAVTDTGARGAGPAPAPPPPPPPDLSRPPKLVSSAMWQCPFPPEADDADINKAVVVLRFEIGADGSMKTVASNSDPGNGFGREAKRCAQSSRWLPALDRAGKPISGVLLVNVRFDR